MKQNDNSYLHLELTGQQARFGFNAEYEQCVLASMTEGQREHRRSLMELTKPLTGSPGAPKINSVRYTASEGDVYEVERYNHIFDENNELLIGRFHGSIDLGEVAYDAINDQQLLKRLRSYIDVQGHHHNPTVVKNLIRVAENVIERANLRGPILYVGSEFAVQVTFMPTIRQRDLFGLQLRIMTPCDAHVRQRSNFAESLTQ